MRCHASDTSTNRLSSGRCRSPLSACSPPSSCTRWRASCRAAFALTAVAYSCSAVASVLHLATVITGNPEPSSIAFLLLTVCYSLIIVALARDDARAGQRPARAVGAGAGAVRRVGLAPWPIPRRRRWLGGRAGRPSRRHPAGVCDPLPGLPVRARRSVPQARADADRDRRDRVRRLHRGDDAAVRTVRGGRAAGVVGGDVAGVAVAASPDRPVRRSVDARPRRLCGAAVEHRPGAAGAELDRRRARYGVRAAGAGACGARRLVDRQIGAARVATDAR